MTEKHVKLEILKTLKKFKVWYYMPPASVYGVRGIPDFICCVAGYMMGIEAKSPKRKAAGLSPTQLLQRHKILASGGIYLVVYDEDGILDLKDEIKAIRRRKKQHD